MKIIALLLASVSLVINLASCGTIIYPERKGQVRGDLDPGIVLLNAVGLLFFFVPGVVAFAVDFSNGTIYLPNGKSSKLSRHEMEAITTNGKVNMDGIHELMSTMVDLPSAVNSDAMRVKKLVEVSELSAVFKLHAIDYAGRGDEIAVVTHH